MLFWQDPFDNSALALKGYPVWIFVIIIIIIIIIRKGFRYLKK